MGKFSVLLLVAIIFTSKIYCLNTTGNTTLPGITRNLLPSFISLNGLYGIQAPLGNPSQGSNMEYMIKLWIRPQQALDQSSFQNALTLFDIQGSTLCQLQFNNAIVCMKEYIQSQSDFISITNLQFRTGMWMHLVFGGSYSLKLTYIRLDFQNQLIAYQNFSYLAVSKTLSTWSAFIGIRSSLQNGFIGDIKDFAFFEGYISQNQVPIIKNMHLGWDQNLLGYYRFQLGSLSDEYIPFSQGSLINQQIPQQLQWSYDTTPNDICYDIVNAAYLPRLDNLSVGTYSIDSRMSTTFGMSSYQYSGSFWFKFYPGSSYSSSFSDNNSIFYLQNVFSIWQQNAYQIRLRIHGQQPYDDMEANPVSSIFGEWINYQFNLDRVNGFTIQIYDTYRSLKQSTSSNVLLPVQNPSSTVKLFNNIKGYVKSILVFQSFKPLPIQPPIGPTSTIKDSSLIIYYKFDYANFINNTLSALNQDSSGRLGNSVSIGGQIKFDEVFWNEQLTYNNSQLLGSPNQTISFYDGVACTNSYFQTNFQGSNAFMTQNLSIASNLTEATIEFWMRKVSLTYRNNTLIELYGQNQEYMHIVQFDNGSTYCEPISINKTQRVLLSTISESNVQSWQYIACKFRANDTIMGVQSSLQQQSSNISLIGFFPIIPTGNYSLIIGNDWTLSNGQVNTVLREIRLWSSYRSIPQLTFQLYRQVDPTLQNGQLIAYYRLANEGFNYTDFPLLQQEQVNYNGLVRSSPDVPLMICPLNTYPLLNQMCYLNPFVKQNLNVFTEFNATTNNITWIMNSLFSDIVTDYLAFSEFTYKWSFANQSMTNFIQNSNSSLTQSFQCINETLFFQNSSNLLYQISLQTMNYEKSFTNEIQQNYQFDLCHYLVDSYYQQPIVALNISNSASNLTLNFTLQQSCQSPYYQSYDISIDNYPSYLGLNMGQNLTYDQANNVFSVNISQSAIQSMPLYTNVSVLITFFDKQDGIRQNNTYLSLGYVIQAVDYNVELYNFTIPQPNPSMVNIPDPFANITLNSYEKPIYLFYLTLLNEANQTFLYNPTSNVINHTILDTKLTIIYEMSNVTQYFQIGVENWDIIYFRIIVFESFNILNLLTNNSFQMNNTIALSALSLIDQVITKQAAIQGMITDYFAFREIYVNTISQLMKFTYEEIEYLAPAKSRRLQLANASIYEQGDMYSISQFWQYYGELQNLLQVYETFVCQSILANASVDVPIITHNTYAFSMVMQRVNSTYKNDYINNTLPFDAQGFNLTTTYLNIQPILNSSVQNESSNFTFECVSQILSHISPVAGYLFPNIETVWNQSLLIDLDDNTGYQMLLSNEQFKYATNEMLQISFNFDYSDERFKNNQTICMTLTMEDMYIDYVDTSYDNVFSYDVSAFQPNLRMLQSSSSTPYANFAYNLSSNWASDGCTTVYDMLNGIMGCTCNFLGNVYYGIATDLTRIRVYDGNGQPLVFYDNGQAMNIDPIVASMIGWLVMMLIVMPVILIILDKVDMDNVRRNLPFIDDYLLRKVGMRNRQHREQVVYRYKYLYKYQDLKKINRYNVCRITFWKIHPFISLFTKFDVQLKRLIRMMLNIYQQMTIAAICIIFFSTQSYSSESQNGSLTQDQILLSIYEGAICSVFLIPYPQCWTDWLKVYFVRDRRKKRFLQQQQQQQKKANTLKQIESSDDSKKSKSTKRLRIEPATNPHSFQPDQDVITYEDSLGCKIFNLILCACFSIVVIAMLCYQCSQMETTQQLQVILSFFVALGVGWVILNPLRMLIIANLIGTLVIQNEKTTNCWQTAFKYLFIDDNHIQTVRDILAVQDYLKTKHLNDALREKRRQDKQSVKQVAEEALTFEKVNTLQLYKQDNQYLDEKPSTRSVNENQMIQEESFQQNSQTQQIQGPQLRASFRQQLTVSSKRLSERMSDSRQYEQESSNQDPNDAFREEHEFGRGLRLNLPINNKKETVIPQQLEEFKGTTDLNQVSFRNTTQFQLPQQSSHYHNFSEVPMIPYPETKVDNLFKFKKRTTTKVKTAKRIIDQEISMEESEERSAERFESVNSLRSDNIEDEDDEAQIYEDRRKRRNSDSF